MYFEGLIRALSLGNPQRTKTRLSTPTRTTGFRMKGHQTWYDGPSMCKVASIRDGLPAFSHFTAITGFPLIICFCSGYTIQARRTAHTYVAIDIMMD